MRAIEERLRRLEETFGLNDAPPPKRPLPITVAWRAEIVVLDEAERLEREGRGTVDYEKLGIDLPVVSDTPGVDAADYLAAVQPSYLADRDRFAAMLETMRSEIAVEQEERRLFGR